MGDRVYASVRIHGPIETTAALEALIEAINADLGYGTHGEDVASEILGAVQSGRRYAFFEAEEVNYADLSTIRSACKEHQIAMMGQWCQGQEFEGGQCTFYPGDAEDDECPSSDEAVPYISLPELEEACKTDSNFDLAEKVTALLIRFRKLNGNTLPQLQVSAEVLAALEMGFPPE